MKLVSDKYSHSSMVLYISINKRIKTTMPLWSNTLKTVNVV
jgi:hypothetical protein